MEASFHPSSPSLMSKMQNENQNDGDRLSVKGREMSLGLNLSGGGAALAADASVNGSLRRTASIEKHSSLKKDMSGSLLVFDDTIG